MSFSSVGGAQAGGSGTSASVTHGQSINSGDLVVYYVNSNTGATAPSIDSDTGGTWTTALAEVPSGESAYHMLAWKVANGTEPSAYSSTVGSAEYRCVVYVFRPTTTFSVDASITSAKYATVTEKVHCTAISGATISDDAVSIVAGGKDNRSASGLYTTADNSYSVVGNPANEAAAIGWRIFTTGTSSITDVVIEPDDGTDGIPDASYSMHISFVEDGGGGGGGANFLTLLGVG